MDSQRDTNGFVRMDFLSDKTSTQFATNAMNWKLIVEGGQNYHIYILHSGGEGKHGEIERLEVDLS